jgi:hypothetical protein
MGSHKLLCSALLLILAVSASVLAQDDDLSLDNLPGDVAFVTADVKHTTVFPDYSTKSFPTNTLIDSYTSFINLGQKSYNVTSIYGSINDASDPNIYLQNLTRLGYNNIVSQGSQHTFEFQFVADPALEPRNYHLLIRADFHDVRTGMPYTLTFVNSTIALTESAAAGDWTGTIVTVAIVGGSVGYVVNKYLQKKAKKAAKAKAASAQHDDQLAGTTLRSMSPSATSPKAKK